MDRRDVLVKRARRIGVKHAPDVVQWAREPVDE
jgi:hypothetical protein